METKSLHIPWPKMPRPVRQIPLISDEFWGGQLAGTYANSKQTKHMYALSWWWTAMKKYLPHITCIELKKLTDTYCKFQLRYHKARLGTTTRCAHLRPHVRLPRFNVLLITVGNISVIHNTKALFRQHNGTLTRYLYIGLGRRNRNNIIFRIISIRHTRNN